MGKNPNGESQLKPPGTCREHEWKITVNMNLPHPISRKIAYSFCALVAILSFTLTGRGEILVKDGESIAFLGDSITQQGWDHPYGYVHLIEQGLSAQNIKIKPIPAGVSGDTSADMLNRVDSVLRQKPTWMTLSCGFNDVSPYCSKRVNLEDFKRNVIEILNKAQTSGVKVIVLTATLFRDDNVDSDLNKNALPYNDFLRNIAKERNLPLADLNEAHRREIRRLITENMPYKGLQSDGLHMNPHGDWMMATGVLKTLGLTDEQISKTKDAWSNNIYRRQINDWKNFTVRQYEAIECYAVKEKIDVNNAIVSLYEKSLIKAAQANPNVIDFKNIRAAADIQFSKDLDELAGRK